MNTIKLSAALTPILVGVFVLLFLWPGPFRASLSKPMPTNAEVNVFVEAAEQHDTGAILKLLGERSNRELLNGICTDTAPDSPIGFTALMVACRIGDFEMIKLLLSRGADINGATTAPCSHSLLSGYIQWNWPPVGWTALMEACGRTRIDVVKFLLAHGANVNATTTDGWTPLRAATWRKDTIGYVDVFEASEYGVYGIYGQYTEAERKRRASVIVQILRQHGAKQ